MRMTHVAAAVFVLAAVTVTSCTQVVAETSACRNLTYKDGEVARGDYVPCVGEIIAALEEVDRKSEAALSGDRQARSEGQQALRRASALMQAAGGRQLLERWSDRALTNLNVDMNNAVTSYSAFYMVRLLDEPNPYAAKSREAARAEFVNGRRSFQDAERTYRLVR